MSTWGPDWLRTTDHAAQVLAGELGPDDRRSDRGGRPSAARGEGSRALRAEGHASGDDGSLRDLAVQGMVPRGPVPTGRKGGGPPTEATTRRRRRSIVAAHPDGCLDAIGAGCDWTDWGDPNIETILEGSSYDLTALGRSRDYAEAEVRASMSKSAWEAREAERAAIAAGKAPKKQPKKARQEALI